MQETQVWSLSREDPPEKGMGIHSSILAWRIPWREDPGGLQLQRTWHDLAAEHACMLYTMDEKINERKKRKFYWSQPEDYNLGDSLSERSEDFSTHQMSKHSYMLSFWGKGLPKYYWQFTQSRSTSTKQVVGHGSFWPLNKIKKESLLMRLLLLLSRFSHVRLCATP